MNLSDDGKWAYDEQTGNWIEVAGLEPPPTGPPNPAGALSPPFTTPAAPTSTEGTTMSTSIRVKWLSQSVIAIIFCLGFIMLISSESYSYSANFTHAPDPPDTVSFSDFEVSYSDYDTDNNGLNTSENENYTAAQNDASENYTAAMDVYNDAHDTYLKSLDDHNDLMTIYAGKAIYWRNIAPGFIVAGLVCMTFQSKAVKMSNSIRLTLLIGTLYMVANMLGYDMPGVDAAIGFGFGG